MMQPFTQHKGLVAALNISNIDTDQIIPKQFLSKVTRDGFGVHLFHDWRYLDEAGNQQNPDFVLNQSAYQKATILLAGENFGCGSSREHAPWALADFGLRAIIASSFADIFYNNALNNGLLPIVLTENQVQQLMQLTAENENYSLQIDLETQQVMDDKGNQFTFEIAASSKHNLVNGLDAIGLSLSKLKQIEKYEQGIPSWRR